MAGQSNKVAQLVLGTSGRIASTVYGTMVVMAALTAAYASEKQPWKLAVVVAGTVFVLWIGHVYAHGLSQSIEQRSRVTKAQLMAISGREIGMLLAAAPPTAALILGAVGLLEEDASVWLAFSIGLVTLAVEGARYSRLEGFKRAGTFAAIAANLALGLVLVALKVAFAH